MIRDLSIEVRAGTVTGLLGPSGCGKTTLMRAIVGAQIVEAGSVHVLGEPAGAASLRTEIGYMAQTRSVYLDLTVLENLRYFGRILGVGQQTIRTTIATVGLEGFEHQITGSLSGGELARVSLAAAMLNAPRVLVLDEPTVGLDPLLREELWGQFRRLAGDGVTVLLSTHVMEEAANCDRLALMRDGALLATDSPTGLLRETSTDDLSDAFRQLVRRQGAGG